MRFGGRGPFHIKVQLKLGCAVVFSWGFDKKILKVGIREQVWLGLCLTTIKTFYLKQIKLTKT